MFKNPGIRQPTSATPLLPAEHQFVAELTSSTTTSRTAAPNRHLAVENFTVELQSANGENLSTQTIALERRAGTQDVVDLLAWYRDAEGIIQVAVINNFRPALLLKDPNKSPWVRSQPGAYNETTNGSCRASLADTTQRILSEKIAVEAKNGANLTILGGSFLPNIKFSPEVVTQLAIEIDPTTLKSTATSNNPFATGRSVKFLPISELLEQYRAGDFQDPRMIAGILELAQQENEPVQLLSLSAEKVPTSASFLLPQINNYSAAKEILTAEPMFNGQPAKLVVTARPAEQSDFLPHMNGTVKITDYTGSSPVVKTLGFEAVQPTSDHNIHCLCYTQDANGKIFILVNHGVRPAIAVRETTPHPIGIKPAYSSTEDFSFALNSSELPLAENVLQAKLKELGIVCDHKNITVVSQSELPSPGFNTCSNSRLLIAVTADQINPATAPLSNGHYWLELQTARELCEKGEIKDLQLNLSINILANALGSDLEPANTWTAAERAELSKIACAPSELLTLIQENAELAAMHRILYREPSYRKLLTYAEQFIGIVTAKLQHNEEAIFFDASVPLFQLPNNLENASFLIQLLHDIKHYAMGAYPPYESDDGEILLDADQKPILRSEDEYRKAYLLNEAAAGFFSHYDLPIMLGLDREHEVVLGFQPLSTVFNNLGITDRAAAYEIFRQIALERTIPSEILQHPAYQDEKNRTALLQLLKLGKVFDLHIKELYPLWTENPEVAKIYLRFSDVQSESLNEYRNNFEDSLRKALEAPEGINPFKADLAKFITAEIRVPALRLAYAKQELLNLISQQPENQALLAELDDQLNDLFDQYHKFLAARDKISTLDFNDDNLQALKLKLSFQENQKQKVAALYQKAVAALPEDLQSKIKGRELPFFPRLEFGNNPEIMDYALEREQFSKNL